MYAWLTHPLLDPQNSGRLIMDNLMRGVSTALEWTYTKGEMDVTALTWDAAAELLTLRRDAIRVIDAPVLKEPQTEQKGEIKDDHPKRKMRPKVSSPEMNSNLHPEVSG